MSHVILPRVYNKSRDSLAITWTDKIIWKPKVVKAATDAGQSL
jgi:hypothetical protein